MAFPWKNMNLIPMHDMAFWHMYEQGVSTQQLCKDYSGNGRDLTCTLVNRPTINTNALNGNPGWYWDGATKIPLAWTGSTLNGLKHIFVVASADEATFAIDRGLLSGAATFGVLVGQVSTNKFYDLSGIFGSYIPSLADVQYSVSTFPGPMSGNFAVIELQSTTGFSLDGIQVGRDRNFTGPSRIWQGYWFEQMAYTTQLTDPERWKIYQYFAMRYWLWQQKTAGGLDVFPFPANKARASQLDQEHFLSEPYMGDPAALVRGNAKSAYTLPFTTRTQAEYEAAEQFHKTHYPVTHFNYRDFRFNPYRDKECAIVSPFREQGSEVTYRFNYAFDIAETS